MKFFTHEQFELARKSLFLQSSATMREMIKSGQYDDPNYKMEAYQEYATRLIEMSEFIEENEHLVVDLDIIPLDADFKNERLPFDTLIIGLESLDYDFEYDLLIATREHLNPDAPIDLMITGYKKKSNHLWEPSSAMVMVDSSKEGIECLAWSEFPGCEVNEEDKVHMVTAAYLIDSIATMINCSNVTLEARSPSKLRMMRARKKKQKLKDFHVIALPNVSYNRKDHQGGQISPQRLHRRRGHRRTYKKGTRYEYHIWIDAYMAGNPRLGSIEHEYEIRDK